MKRLALKSALSAKAASGDILVVDGLKLDEVKTYAAMAYTALNCEGLARCDFFVEHGTNRVMINEINTFPGFTPISMYPKLMEHEGLPVPQLIDRLIALALERKEKQHG